MSALIQRTVQGLDLKFETAPTLFSPSDLDSGSLALLSQVRIERGDKVLDLGCGYGLLGLFAAKFTDPQLVFLIDQDTGAIECAARNVILNGVEGVTCTVSDGFRDFRESGFTKILCNPPYHVDFSVPKHFIEKGFNRLAVGGAMWMVTKREQWYRNKLSAIFGGVRVYPVGSYFVFEAKKMSQTYARCAQHGQRSNLRRGKQSRGQEFQKPCDFQEVLVAAHGHTRWLDCEFIYTNDGSTWGNA
jgi:16S rRNA (guanine1207-N2)-methyltransferase